MFTNANTLRQFLSIFLGTHWPRQRPAGGFGAIFSWMERARQRRQLADLDTHLLADIGVTAEQVRRECRRPFWA